MAGLNRHLGFCPSPTPHEKTLDEEYNVICLFNLQMESRSGLTSTAKYLICFFFQLEVLSIMARFTLMKAKWYTVMNKYIMDISKEVNPYLQLRSVLCYGH